MARPKTQRTKYEILQCATKLFLEKGYTDAYVTTIANTLQISTGNLTFWFPTKEHILAVLVEMMIDYQWKEMEKATDEGKSSLLAYCLELSTLASLSEDVPEMHEFLTAAYSHPLTLDLIRARDADKVARVFSEYTKDWDEERFVEIEAIVSGIEYATLMNTQHSASLPHRIKGALDSIMLLFGVPADVRKLKIDKVLSMDYRSVAMDVYSKFKAYVMETNVHALDEALKNTKIKAYR